MGTWKFFAVFCNANFPVQKLHLILITDTLQTLVAWGNHFSLIHIQSTLDFIDSWGFPYYQNYRAKWSELGNAQKSIGNERVVTAPMAATCHCLRPQFSLIPLRFARFCPHLSSPSCLPSSLDTCARKTTILLPGHEEVGRGNGADTLAVKEEIKSMLTVEQQSTFLLGFVSLSSDN